MSMTHTQVRESWRLYSMSYRSCRATILWRRSNFTWATACYFNK